MSTEIVDNSKTGARTRKVCISVRSLVPVVRDASSGVDANRRFVVLRRTARFASTFGRGFCGLSDHKDVFGDLQPFRTL